METKYWPDARERSGLLEAAAALAAGGVVAFPTETVYGLGGDARDSGAVEKIFAAKGRPSDNPLIVHIAVAEDADKLAREINGTERRLMSAFWPGPLTLVLPAREGAVSPLVTAGLDTVAVRVPAHETARMLIEASGCPLAAPSANRSGRPSPTQAAHVIEDLGGRIDGVVDGGPTGVGLESTVARVVGNAVHILRPGGVTLEQLREAVGPEIAVVAEADVSEAGSAPRSPGVKYAHYAPKGDMLLVAGDPDRIPAAVQASANEARGRGLRVAILCCSERTGSYDADAVLDCGPAGKPEVAARSLYALLRECDERGIDYIVAEGFSGEGIGAALMNRLRKAAGGREKTV